MSPLCRLFVFTLNNKTFLKTEPGIGHAYASSFSQAKRFYFHGKCSISYGYDPHTTSAKSNHSHFPSYPIRKKEA